MSLGRVASLSEQPFDMLYNAQTMDFHLSQDVEALEELVMLEASPFGRLENVSKDVAQLVADVTVQASK